MKRITVFACLILLSVMCGVLSAQDNNLDGAILVANKTRSSVSIIFTDSTKASITIPTGEGPSEIVISPDRKLAVVSNYGYLEEGSSLTFIDLENYSLLKNLELERYVRPNGLAFLPKPQTQSTQSTQSTQGSISTQTQDPIPTIDPISTLLLVTFENRRSIAVIDIEAGSIIKEIRTNQEKPLQIAIHPTGNAAYVTNEISGTVSVLDLNDYTLVGNIEIGRGIEGIDVSPNGKEIWVANKVDNTIHILETTDHKVIASFESPVFPTRLKFTPNGKNVIVLNTRSGHISYIDVKTRRDVLYSSSDDFAEIFDEELSFVESDTGLTAVRQMNENLNERIQKVKFGELAIPVGLGISPNGDYAFVSNSVKNSVSVMSLFGEYIFELKEIFHLNNTPGGVAFLPSEVNVMVYNTNSEFDEYWAANRPMTKYFKEMADAADEDFMKEFETPFMFVLDNDEIEEYEDLPDGAAKKIYIKDYINSKDENPLYPVNYWFLEYISRVTYVKKNYSLTKIPWIDERGKFYIKYGPPFRKYKDPGGLKKNEYLLSQIDQSDPIRDFDIIDTVEEKLEAKLERAKLPPPYYSMKPNESWSYLNKQGRGFVVHFAKDKYYKELKNGLAGMLESRKQTDVSWYWMDIVKDRFFLSFDINAMVTMIERWEIEYSGSYDFTDIDINRNNIAVFLNSWIFELSGSEETNKVKAIPSINTRLEKNNLIDFNLESAQFKARNKETRIKFVTYTDPNEIEIKSTPDEEKFLNLEMQYLFRDSSLTDIYRSKTNDKFGKYEKLHSIFLTTETSLLPIEGDLTIQLQNTDTKELGFKKYPIAVRDFSGSELMLSDILYYTPIQSVGFDNSYTAENIKNSDVIPYPYPHVVRELPVMCYFEVYNLVRGREGTMYEVELKLTKDSSGENVFQKLGGVFRGGGKEVRSMKYQITEYENDSKQLIGFDLSKVDKGNYDLEITITSIFDDKITASSLKKIVIK